MKRKGERVPTGVARRRALGGAADVSAAVGGRKGKEWAQIKGAFRFGSRKLSEFQIVAAFFPVT